MSGAGQQRNRPGVIQGPLSGAASRRTARRRQIRRRRVTALLTVAAALALAAIVISGGGHSGAALHVGAAGPAPAGPAGHPSRPSAPPPAHSVAANPTAASLAAPVHRVLAYTSYVQLAGHRRREVALTFDDGPSPYTPQVLHILSVMHVPATFFVIGRSVGTYPQYVADESRGGEEVGDHTETHPPLGQLSPSLQTTQLTDAAGAITRAGAPAPVLMRPPYGSFDTATLGVLHSLGLLMVLWSVDTKDYARPGVSRIEYTAISGAQPGAVILMHDGGGDRSETVAALPRIITRLRQRGYKLVTVSQLLADDPPPRNQPPPHSLSGF
jgi:peptidoglycan-N-acetylglucosamine deacetylase